MAFMKTTEGYPMSKFTEPFTLETAKLFFDYDKETGKVYWKKRTPDLYQTSYNPGYACNRFNAMFAGKVAGRVRYHSRNHAKNFSQKIKAWQISFLDPRTGRSSPVVAVHRLVWLFENGYWPKQMIDHINGDPTDNRIENLRYTDVKRNSRNQSMYRTNKSGYTGVYYDKKAGKWCACIGVDRKSVHLGLFTDKEAAIEARKLAEKQYGFDEDHGKRIASGHGVKINDESSTTPSVCSGNDSPPEPVQGELSFL